jgi:hypothetical protein
VNRFKVQNSVCHLTREMLHYLHLIRLDLELSSRPSPQRGAKTVSNMSDIPRMQLSFSNVTSLWEILYRSGASWSC